MTQLLSLKLDGLPPSVNQIWRAVNGRVLKSREYRAWLDAAAWELKSQAKGQTVEGGYALHVEIGRPDKRRRDLDNLVKGLSDAIVHAGCVSDDRHCERLQAEWSDRPGVRLWIVSTSEEGGAQSWA